MALSGSALAQPVSRNQPPVVVLSNGLRAVGYEDHSTNLVGVFLALRISADSEPANLHGARDLLQEAFRYRLEKQLRSDPRYLDLTSALLVGHGVDLGTEWDYLSLLTMCPRSELRALLQVLGRVVFVDPLTPDAMAAAQRQLALQSKAYQTNPAEATYYLFRRALLGPSVPPTPAFADAARLSQISVPDLEAYRAKYVVPPNALIVLVGPDRPEQLLAEAVESLVAVPKRPAPTGWPPHFSLQPAGVQVATSATLAQGPTEIASLIVGYRFPAPSDADYPAGLVLFEMLSGRQGVLQSNQKLREALATATYGPVGAEVGDQLQLLGPVPSAVPYAAVHVRTDPSQVGRVQAALVEAFHLVTKQINDPAAVERGKERALSTLALAGLDQGGRARRLGEWYLFSFGWQDFSDLPTRLRAVKAADLARVAQRCLAREYVGVQMPE
ncbi:MAG TPA: insulinase family protein [Armatimonadota bacterium]